MNRIISIKSRCWGARLYKVSIDGGSPVPVTDYLAYSPTVSPDGKLIACFSTDSQSRQQKLFIIPFEGGAPLKTLDTKMMEFTVLLTPLRWTPDGKSLIYIDKRQVASNLWRLPLDGGAPQQVTKFNDAQPERIWSFDLSRDGKQLVIARGGVSTDVVLISEVK